MNKRCLPVKYAKGQELFYINTHLINTVSFSIFQLLIFAIIFPHLTAILATFTVSQILTVLSQQYHAIDIWGINLNSKLTHINKPENKLIDNDYYIFNEPIYAIDDGEVVDIRNRVSGSVSDKLLCANLSYFLSLKFLLVPWEQIIALAGNYIIIKHKSGEYSFYAHLNKDTLKVKPGDKVHKGQHIANVGDSGNSTEPHLHFQITRFNPKFMEIMQSINKPINLAGAIVGIPAFIPNVITKDLEGFEPHKYFPLTNSDNKVIGSMKIFNKLYGDMVLDNIDKSWKLNNTGKIHPFCVVKHMK